MNLSRIFACTKEFKRVSKSVSMALGFFVGTHIFTEFIFKMLVIEVFWLLKFPIGHRSRGCVFLGNRIAFVMM